MAQRLDIKPPTVRPPRQPLDQWFDGNVWRIEETDHNAHNFDTFCSGLYARAKKRGRRLHRQQETFRTGLIWTTTIEPDTTAVR